MLEDSIVPLLPTTQQGVMQSWQWRFNLMAYDIYLGPCLPYYLETQFRFISYAHIFQEAVQQQISMSLKQNLVLLVLIFSYYSLIVCSFCIVFPSSFMVLLIYAFFSYSRDTLIRLHYILAKTIYSLFLKAIKYAADHTTESLGFQQIPVATLNHSIKETKKVSYIYSGALESIKIKGIQYPYRQSDFFSINIF